jgi:hypothetical protein
MKSAANGQQIINETKTAELQHQQSFVSAGPISKHTLTPPETQYNTLRAWHSRSDRCCCHCARHGADDGTWRVGEGPGTPRRQPGEGPGTPRRQPGEGPGTPRRQPGEGPGTPRRQPTSHPPSLHTDRSTEQATGMIMGRPQQTRQPGHSRVPCRGQAGAQAVQGARGVTSRPAVASPLGHHRHWARFGHAVFIVV